MIIHYKFVYEVLSDVEIDGWTMDEIVKKSLPGYSDQCLVAVKGGFSKRYLNDEEAVAKLIEFGNRPEFFGLEDIDES
jgi:hypothetical protein